MAQPKISSKATAVFLTLTLAGVAMAVVARFVPGFEQLVLVGVGSGMFGGALAFFLNQAFKSDGQL